MDRTLTAQFSAIGFFLVLTFILPIELSAQSFSKNLAKLNGVATTVEELNTTGKEMSLAEENLNAHLILLLRNKLPKLRVDQSSFAAVLDLGVLLENVVTTAGAKAGVYGIISLQIISPATIEFNGKQNPVIVWRQSKIVTGPRQPQLVRTHVYEQLDALTTHLAADWLQANP